MYVKLKNGNVYAAGPEDNKELFIYTRKSEKADASFQKTEVGYKKHIHLLDPSVEEYFDLKWMVKLDVGIKGVTNEWHLGGDSDLSRNKVVLRYGRGNLPGWIQEDRGVCSKEYDFEQASAQYVEKIVVIRRGAEYRIPRREKKRMTKADFKKAMSLYAGGNL